MQPSLPPREETLKRCCNESALAHPDELTTEANPDLCHFGTLPLFASTVQPNKDTPSLRFAEIADDEAVSGEKMMT